MNFDTRFHVIVDHIAPIDSDYEVWRNSGFKGVVKDGEKIIFETECVLNTGNYSKDVKVKDIPQKNN